MFITYFGGHIFVGKVKRHSFGTIKRQWGFDHILSRKGKKRASADVGFILIAYNPKRILNLIGKEGWNMLLKAICSYFSALISRYKSILRTIEPINSGRPILSLTFKPSSKNLILVNNWQK
jgi:hypothetical protein